MLCPTLETFKTNKVTLALVIILGLVAELIFYLIESENPTVELINVGFVAGVALLLAWLLSVRVSLHDDGISYRSLFGSKEMRWDEIERFHYSAVYKGSDEGTYYSFKLIDAQGRKISVGEHLLVRSEELGAKLIEYTYPPLFRKAADLFSSGVEMDFGAIRLSRDSGVKIKKAMWIPWEQVSDYQTDEQYFYLCQLGNKHPTTFRFS